MLDIFANPDLYDRKTVPIVGEILSPREMVKTFEHVTGRKAEYRDAFHRDGLLHHFPEFAGNDLHVQELLGMVEYAVEFGYFGKDHDLEWSRRIDPEAQTWEQFLQSTGWQGEKMSFGG